MEPGNEDSHMRVGWPGCRALAANYLAGGTTQFGGTVQHGRVGSEEESSGQIETDESPQSTKSEQLSCSVTIYS